MDLYSVEKAPDGSKMRLVKFARSFPGRLLPAFKLEEKETSELSSRCPDQILSLFESREFSGFVNEYAL